MVNKKDKNEDNDKIRFFGNSDRQEGGAIKSTYPGWYNDYYVDLTREEINSINRRKALGEIPEDHLSQAMQDRNKLEETLKAVTDERPKPTKLEKDKLAKVRKEIGDSVSEQMPTRSQMDTGDDVNINTEAAMKENPSVKLSREAIEYAESMGISVTKKGFATRDAATREWQIIGKLLGEETNSESLRKSGMHPEKHYIVTDRHTEADAVMDADAVKGKQYEVHV